MVQEVLVQTDRHGGTVLAGHPNQPYLLTELADGTLVLRPVAVSEAAQRRYDADRELRGLLARAASSPTVRRRT